jgi:RES domain-containing protein
MILFKVIKKPFVATWNDYEKTSSFTDGFRWNAPRTPIMYLSSNVQNAMLEIANYMPNPKMVNKLYEVAVFEFPELRLHSIEPTELTPTWNTTGHNIETQDLGMKYLSNDKDWDGIKIPSATINEDIATNTINTIRESVYANVAVNLLTIGVDRISLLKAYSPVYSNRMFA